MESSRACTKCRKKTLTTDDKSGATYCASCGVVQEFDNFQSHFGGINGPTGTYVRIGTAGSGSDNSYKERKIYFAKKSIEDFMFKLGYSGSDKVKDLIEKVTDKEYGQGEWFQVLIGACAYIIMRKDEKMLPIVEVADLVGCDIYELGRMIKRVVDFTGLELPEFDIVNSFKHSVETLPSFSNAPKDLIEKMLQQGIFIVQCLIKWFITTGRKPMPVVAAVLVFVGELNEVDVKIEEVAKELRVAVCTCRRRYKELLERLVKVARVLPWGKDVTVKNIVKNAPCVIHYMELKSMKKKSEKGIQIEDLQCDMEGLVEDCLSGEIGYGFSSGDYSSNYFKTEHISSLLNENKFQISPESLAMIYSRFMEEVSSVKDIIKAESGAVNKRRRPKTFDIQTCSDWWSGKSELSKKLILKEILAKDSGLDAVDVGLDAMPPSFDRGCELKAKRQDKIRAAKLRIQRIKHPNIDSAGFANDVRVWEPEKPKKKRKMQVETDWEDLIIETLLLHRVKEEEIVNGHYNTLLALHVFN